MAPKSKSHPALLICNRRSRLPSPSRGRTSIPPLIPRNSPDIVWNLNLIDDDSLNRRPSFFPCAFPDYFHWHSFAKVSLPFSITYPTYRILRNLFTVRQPERDSLAGGFELLMNFCLCLNGFLLDVCELNALLFGWRFFSKELK